MSAPREESTLAIIGALVGGVLAFAAIGYLVGLLG